MKINVGVCPLCGKRTQLIQSNNPIVASVCGECLNKEIDRKSLKQANLFCRSYNLPFDPNKWLEIEKESGKDVFRDYVNLVGEEYSNTLYNSNATDLLWERADAEWQKDMTNQELLARIQPIKEGFLKRMSVQWGSEYTFEEYLKLENLYTNTVRSNGITNPLTLDVVRKIAVVSVAMDQALKTGEIAAASDYNKMHTTLIKSAGLDDMVEVGDSNVIATVADLCQFIEDSGGVFKYYDGVSRDVVDETIKDMQNWTREFVTDNAGINPTYHLIEEQYKKKMQAEVFDQATKEKPLVSLEDMFDKAKQGVDAEFDAEVERDDVDLEDPNYGIDDPDY